MTRPNPLVLDGGEVKLRIEAERLRTGSVVHVDWLRFTCLLRNVVPSFRGVRVASDIAQSPRFGSEAFHALPEVLRRERMAQLLNDFALNDPEHSEFGVMCQALELAKEACECLGSEFVVSEKLGKGHDFYKYRWSIERAGAEVGWVGFLASGDSPRQQNQSQTLHVNLYGSALTFAAIGAPDRLANMVDVHEGKITRVDLALDFFDGMRQSLPDLLEAYKVGEFDVCGRRPASSVAGDWGNGAERSLYVGCRKSGKVTNIYEKGDQLFGREANSPWVRVELRYGNKLRVLSSDILRRPADFFAGASDWHQSQILAAGSAAAAVQVKQTPKLARQTVAAEVRRNIRWAFTAAAPTVAAAFKYLNPSEFLELCNWEVKQLPGRLRKFSDSDLRTAFTGAMGDFLTAERSPAFA